MDWNNFLFLFIFLPIIMDSLEEKYDNLIGALDYKKKGEKILMEKMLHVLSDKYCIIKTLKGDYVGVLVEVSSTGLILKNNDVSQFVNLEYIVSVKELPLNKKGKPKRFSL